MANTENGVFIRINSSESVSTKFIDEILKNKPLKSRIINHSKVIIDKELFYNFKIINSFETKDGIVIIPPDFAMCKQCENELSDKNNRRFYYPFITCTNCGPRFSIIKKLPYDRKFTTMHNFEMCDDCNSEYDETKERRFFSQTNSCNDCGVELSFFDGKTKTTDSYDKLINKTVSFLEKGKIVAVKGIGGYLLLVDAKNKKAIRELRKRKNRPAKPFAIMVKNEDVLNKIAFVTKDELNSWNSSEAEIVLFNIKPEAIQYLVLDEIIPNLSKVGVMRPYAPILKLISDNFDNGLIATSANVSGSPIIYKDLIAKEYLLNIADCILLNNREIVVPQDDSVVQFSEKGTRIVLRRSRGIAPNYFGNPINKPEQILAVGSLLKSAFSVYKNNQFYISQYLGNTDYYDSQLEYEKTFHHLKSIVKSRADTVICDLHPDYFSTQFAENISSKLKIKLEKVQHHEAHFSAVLGENNLLDKEVLGFVWDGTGLGNDDNIWGGEVFNLKNRIIERKYNSNYEKHILGDKMVYEPRLSALSFFLETKNSEKILKSKFREEEYKLYTKFIKKSSLLTSSMGRLFDAIASLLLLKDINDYEGESAMILESLASEYKEDISILNSYDFEIRDSIIDFTNLKMAIIEDILDNCDKSKIAMKFHITLVEIISRISEKEKVKDLAFSGGVFQNALLVSLIEKCLTNKNNLYFHKQLSPNDECISFGQIIRYSLKK